MQHCVMQLPAHQHMPSALQHRNGALALSQSSRGDKDSFKSCPCDHEQHMQCLSLNLASLHLAQPKMRLINIVCLGQYLGVPGQ